MEKNTVKITFGFPDGSPDKVFVHDIEHIFSEHLMSLGKRADSYIMEVKTDTGELIKIEIANRRITGSIIK